MPIIHHPSEEWGLQPAWEYIGTDTIYIINDKYFPYRKALAEGKTIQYNPYRHMPDAWEDTNTIDTSYKPKYYRVKPE